MSDGNREQREQSNDARLWLAKAVEDVWPDVVPSPFPLIAANQWYVTTRYPDIEEESPASNEIEQALQVLESLMAAIAALVR